MRSYEIDLVILPNEVFVPAYAKFVGVVVATLLHNYNKLLISLIYA